MDKKRKYHIGREGRRVIGRIISIKGHCTYGLRVGDEFHLSCQSPGGLCGNFYYTIYPHIKLLQFGGKCPESWGGVPHGVHLPRHH